MFHERRMERNVGQVFRTSATSPCEDLWGSRGRAPQFGVLVPVWTQGWESRIPVHLTGTEARSPSTYAATLQLFHPSTWISSRGRAPNGSNIAYGRHIETVSGGSSTC
jgi:hypothetical protein